MISYIVRHVIGLTSSSNRFVGFVFAHSLPVRREARSCQLGIGKTSLVLTPAPLQRSLLWSVAISSPCLYVSFSAVLFRQDNSLIPLVAT